MTLNTPQPPPQHNADAGAECWPSFLDEVEPEPWLEQLIKERDAMGRAKYGVPLRVWDGRDAVADALQEALDLVVYLHRALLRAEAALEVTRKGGHVDVARFGAVCALSTMRSDAVRMVRKLHGLDGRVPAVKP